MENRAVMGESVLAKYKHATIDRIEISRAPITSTIMIMIDVMSGRRVKEVLLNSPHDSLFHLQMIIHTNKGIFSLEKNEVITMVDRPKPARMAEERVIMDSQYTSSHMTIENILKDVRSNLGDDKFFGYSAKDNNCQDFIVAVLKSISLDTTENVNFTKADTRAIFKDRQFMRKITNTITQVAGKMTIIRPMYYAASAARTFEPDVIVYPSSRVGLIAPEYRVNLKDLIAPRRPRAGRPAFLSASSDENDSRVGLTAPEYRANLEDLITTTRRRDFRPSFLSSSYEES
jgi:hypothetical protein